MVTAGLRAANLLLGGAMILLGLALPDVAFIDTGHEAGTDAFGLIRFHFVLTGAVSLWASASPAGAALSAVLMVLAPLNIGIAPISYFAGGEVRWWLILLASASASSLLVYFIDSQSKAAAVADAANVPLDDLPPPDFAARPMEQAGAASVIVNTLLVIAFGPILAFAGGIYLDLILAAVAYRQEVDIAAAFLGAESGAFANLFAELRVEILSAVVGFALLSAFSASWTGMLRDRIDAAAPDFDRPLSEPERVFLRDACDALADRFSEPAPS